MKIHTEKPMAPMTSFRIGGRARRLYELREREDLPELYRRLDGDLSRAEFLGRGSNTLLKNGIIETPFVRLDGDYKRIRFEEHRVTAGAAVDFPELSMTAARRGWAGLEWASGVPGTVGGAVMMNAGAFDHETADVLTRLVYLDEGGEIRRVPADQVDFEYRFCSLRDRVLLLEATFELRPDDAREAVKRTRELIRTRRQQQPVGYSSAGCVFRNPTGDSAGRLIDAAGLKGESEGPVEVSRKHANYFINHGGARRKHVLDLIERVREGVLSEFGVELDLELRIPDE